jgi:hypothetical protein
MNARRGCGMRPVRNYRATSPRGYRRRRRFGPEDCRASDAARSLAEALRGRPGTSGIAPHTAAAAPAAAISAAIDRFGNCKSALRAGSQFREDAIMSLNALRK